jgi:hypothetical protein
VSRLSDPELLRQAEAVAAAGRPTDGYRLAFREAVQRSAGALWAFTNDDAFREAIAWQSPSILRTWMSRVRGARDVQSLHRPPYARLVASYAQRYTTKNDTIGYFGPVGWARWDRTCPDVKVATGPRLLRGGRSLYFEDWAIEAVASSLSQWPDLHPWHKPRPVASCHVDGTAVHRPYGSPVLLDADDAGLFLLCDGERNVREICRALDRDQASVIGRLLAWRDLDILHFDLVGPVEARPEITLRRKLAEVGEARPRDRALAVLTRLEEARDRLGAARGDPESVARRMAELDQVFTGLTGADAGRRAGQAYAGRTLVYEEARRDVDVVLGDRVLRHLSAPLAIVLDSASWLVRRAGEVLESRLREVFDSYRARTGSDSMPLPALLARATRFLHPQSGQGSPLSGVVDEFQQRWAQLIDVPSGARRHTTSATSIAGSAARLFPRSPAPWPGAAYICPDLMIAASSVRELAAGEFQMVLGEVHLANNTLQARPFVEQHDDPQSLVAAVESDYPRRRLYSVPTRKWPQVNSRSYPSALLPPSYVYWCLHDDTGGAAGPVLAAAAMTVHQQDDHLIVRAAGDDRVFPLTDVLDEQLSWAVVNLFEVLPRSGHQPRVTVDRLVIHRESWTVEPWELDWVRSRVALERFRLAQRWRQRHQLPLRVFYRTPGEIKPCFLDFSSPALVDCFSKNVRAGIRSAPGSPTTVVEMFPDLDQVWLPGPDGERYTSEFRLVCLNERVWSPSITASSASP